MVPRNNRPRRRRVADADRELDLSRVLAGFKRVERRRDGEWYVQPVSAERAVKEYSCPGCGTMIEVSVAHLVTWRADGVLGDSADLASRRHWHTHCWRIRG